MEPPHSKTTLLFHIINTLKKNPKIIWKSRNQTPRSLLFPFSIPKFNENNTAIFHLLSGKTFRSILVTNRPSPLKRSSKDSIVFVQTLLKDLQVKSAPSVGGNSPRQTDHQAHISKGIP